MRNHVYTWTALERPNHDTRQYLRRWGAEYYGATHDGTRHWWRLPRQAADTLRSVGLYCHEGPYDGQQIGGHGTHVSPRPASDVRAAADALERGGCIGQLHYWLFGGPWDRPYAGTQPMSDIRLARIEWPECYPGADYARCAAVWPDVGRCHTYLVAECRRAEIAAQRIRRQHRPRTPAVAPDDTAQPVPADAERAEVARWQSRLAILAAWVARYGTPPPPKPIDPAVAERERQFVALQMRLWAEGQRQARRAARAAGQ